MSINMFMITKNAEMYSRSNLIIELSLNI